MKLTVLGATGGTGRQLVRQALDAGHQVTAVVRDPSRLPVTGAGLDVVTVADITDAAALRPAIAGRDAVLSGLGPANRKATGIAANGTRAIVRAMETTDVRRLLVISAVPVGPVPAGESLLGRTVVFPLVRAIFKNVYADLAAMEAELAAGAVDWTAVRPGYLTDKPLTGRYRKQIAGNVPGAGSMSRADLAYAMLDLLDDPATIKQAVGLGSAGGRGRGRG